MITTPYQFGQYQPSSPSTKELRVLSLNPDLSRTNTGTRCDLLQDLITTFDKNSN